MSRRVRVSLVEAAGPGGRDAAEIDPDADEQRGDAMHRRPYRERNANRVVVSGDHAALPRHPQRVDHAGQPRDRGDLRLGRHVEVVVDGWRFELVVEDAARAELRRRATREEDAAAADGPAEIRAIIPGRVAAVRVVAGDAVEAGRTLLIVEAMKMQNELRAPRAGTVERVAVGEGQTIENGDVLVVLR